MRSGTVCLHLRYEITSSSYIGLFSSLLEVAGVLSLTIYSSKVCKAASETLWSCLFSSKKRPLQANLSNPNLAEGRYRIQTLA